MLYHVKYRNSIFKRIEKNLNIICHKKYTMPYSTVFRSMYNNSVCSLMYNSEILYLSELKKPNIISAPQF